MRMRMRMRIRKKKKKSTPMRQVIPQLTTTVKIKITTGMMRKKDMNRGRKVIGVGCYLFLLQQ
jgi:hypothetical protein